MDGKGVRLVGTKRYPAPFIPPKFGGLLLTWGTRSHCRMTPLVEVGEGRAADHKDGGLLPALGVPASEWAEAIQSGSFAAAA